MRSASLAIGRKANIGTDAHVGRNDAGVGQSRRGRRLLAPFAVIMAHARLIRRNKVAHELARITGRSVRTAERWLSGELTPDGEAALALFLSEMGPAFLAAKVEEMTPEHQEAFWREMGKAQKRADFRRRRAALEREIRETGLDP